MDANMNVKTDRANANLNMSYVGTEIVLQVRTGDPEVGESDGNGD
jgi:hypothetical protein